MHKPLNLFIFLKMKENCQYYDFNELNFTSVQGAIITLPYCFLNSEVQGVVKLHWNRFVASSDCWKILKKLKQAEKLKSREMKEE